MSRPSDVYLPLGRATVFLSDDDVRHYRASEISTMAVSGRRVDASVPVSSALTVSRDNLLHASKTLPNSDYLHLRSRSAQLQEFVLVEVGKKVTTATLKDFIAHPSLERIIDISPKYELNFFGLVGGNGSIWQRQQSKTGRDVAISFPLRATTTDVKLHKGQARVVTVGS